MFLKILYFYSFLYCALAFGSVYTANNYPNPRIDYKKCNMKTMSNVCDPHELLNESDRWRIQSALQTLATRSGQGGTAGFCDRKGLESMLTIIDQASQSFADDLNKKWAIDAQCQKTVLFVYSGNDHQLYMSTQPKSGISQLDFNKVMDNYRDRLKNTDELGKTLAAIIKELGTTKFPEVVQPSRPITPTKASKSIHKLFTMMFALILTLVLV